GGIVSAFYAVKSQFDLATLSHLGVGRPIRVRQESEYRDHGVSLDRDDSSPVDGACHKAGPFRATRTCHAVVDVVPSMNGAPRASRSAIADNSAAPEAISSIARS